MKPTLALFLLLVTACRHRCPAGTHRKVDSQVWIDKRTGKVTRIGRDRKWCRVDAVHCEGKSCE